MEKNDTSKIDKETVFKIYSQTYWAYLKEKRTLEAQEKTFQEAEDVAWTMASEDPNGIYASTKSKFVGNL